MTEAEATLSVFVSAGLNASVALCADADTEIRRLEQKASWANATHDTLPQCSRWALTGACARRPLFMHSRCSAHAIHVHDSTCTRGAHAHAHAHAHARVRNGPFSSCTPRCVVSCLLLGPRYQEAAHSRTPPRLMLLLPQLLLVLAAALALSYALSSLALRRGGIDAAEASSGGGSGEASREAAGALSRMATLTPRPKPNPSPTPTPNQVH